MDQMVCDDITCMLASCQFDPSGQFEHHGELEF